MPRAVSAISKGEHMLRNYLKIAFRNLIHRRTFSLINIMGLALGITAVILILLWVQDEVSYDRFHANGKDICKVYLSGFTGNEKITVDHTFGPMAADMRSRYPEVINATRYHKIEEARVRAGAGKESSTDRLFMERNMAAADPAFLEMFTFPLVKGDPATALASPYSVLLTENMAEKYFGREDPIGKTLTIDSRDDMQVTGVLKNVPHNSDLQFDFLVPASYIERRGGNIDTYGNNNCEVYLQLKDGASHGALKKKIEKGYDKTLPESGLMKLHHHLLPFEDVHLYGNAIVPRIAIVYVFIVLAFFILLIACINFINLSTARSMLRMKEIGVKKAVGARRSQLIAQFLLESTLVAAIALAISVVLLEPALPLFNQFTQNQLAIDWLSFRTWLGLGAITVITGVLAGFYPAFYLSSFTPNRVLRGQTSFSKAYSGRARLRKILVVAQFALTIILAINIINTARWDKYLHELGFDKDNVFYVQNRGNNYDVLKAKLLTDPNVGRVTTASHLPINMTSILGSEWGLAPSQQNSPVCRAWVGYDYIETFGLKMVAGRFYSPDHPSDESDGIIINEKALRVLDVKDPIGKRIYVLGKAYTVTGVIQDFHFVPKVFEIKPLILQPAPKGSNWVFIKLNTGDDNQQVAAAIKRIETVFRELYPDFPFEYQFLNEYRFKEEQMMATANKVIIGFAVFGIIVAALGLFGLSSFLVEQRTKEIGIRKILGASKLTILNLLTNEFFKLILIANLIAWPLSYAIETMANRIFAYQLDFAYWMFAAAGFFSLLTAIAAVCFQAMRAAAGNPVNALRYE
jgi:ABC-type antimicrobial peptide transport system permease subunit